MRDKEIIGILLLNLGGPDSLQAVKPFLYNLFSDRQIIRLGPEFLQKPLARLIAAMRSKKTENMYSLIGGRSPILDITKDQAMALEYNLNEARSVRLSPFRFKVYIGMRYWHPMIEEVVPMMYDDRVKKIIALSLYPHYSDATTGSSFSKLKEVASRYSMDVYCLPSWFDHPYYIEALVEVVIEQIELFRADHRKRSGELKIHLLFSAHNLPKKMIDSGDPYVEETMGTAKKVGKRFSMRWHLSYQSKSGPVEWLKPTTDEKIKELASSGVENIIIVPISFVSDHIETLYEIDILYKNMADNLGVNLRRTRSLNLNSYFITALHDMIYKEYKRIWAK